MTKYQVNGGDKSERGDEAISPEAKQKPAGNKGKYIEGQPYRNIGFRSGTQLGGRIADPNRRHIDKGLVDNMTTCTSPPG